MRSSSGGANTIAFLVYFGLSIIAALPAGAREAKPEARPSDPRECLTLALYHEARSESDESILKHAWAIIWRVKRDDFPNNICDVIFDRYKFSAFNRGIPPMEDEDGAERVGKIADIALKKAFPDTFGGSRCLERDIYTDACVMTVADMIPTPVGVVTHYAVADCYYLRRPGYRYVRTKSGNCVPAWAVGMIRVDAEPCARVRHRACQVVFWKAD